MITKENLKQGILFKIRLPRDNSGMQQYREYKIIQLLEHMALCEDAKTRVKETFSYWDLKTSAYLL